MTRTAVVDIGTNSTRLLIADVEAGEVRELDRRTKVTRLGDGVDAAGALSDEAIARVLDTVDEYAEAVAAAEVEAVRAVLTSAVRDAANGAEFAARVRERYGWEADAIAGDEEAGLTFVGATAGREVGVPLLVVDIGGGSTELVIGTAGEPDFHVSVQMGVVRQTERHLHDDPPAHHELEALADEVRELLLTAVPGEQSRRTRWAVAVAGTPTSCAAIAQELDPYEPARVEGYVLERGQCEEILARLAVLPLDHRRQVTGLHPDRAPTIVAGVVILDQILRAFGLDEVEVSEHDLLWGVSLALGGGDYPAKRGA